MCKKRGRNYVQYRKKGNLHGEKENYLYRERKEIILCTLSERKYVRREKGNMYGERKEICTEIEGKMYTGFGVFVFNSNFNQFYRTKLLDVLY